ncbi:MAG: YcxB family protein [Saccharofermentanales bacterium]
MEPEFINEYVMTKAINMEFADKSFKVYRKGYRAATFALFLFAMGFAVLLLMSGMGELAYLAIIMVPASLFFLYMSLRGYIIGTNAMYKSLVNVYGEHFLATVKFTPDHIESNTAMSSLSIPYDKITEVLETPCMYALMVGKQGMQQRAVLVMKDAFTKGTAEEFLSFVREKGVDVRR